MIDRELNYGRHIIKDYLYKSMPYRSVLDIGAGSGADLDIAREINPTSTISAIECYGPSAQVLKNKSICVEEINIENDIYPFADSSIDVIIANQILEHTKELFWIFHQISRMLPIGGKLIIGVPNLASLHNRILLLLGQQPTSIQINSAHIRGYTLEDTIKFLNSCFPGGYELMSRRGSNFYPFPSLIARPLAQVFPSAAWGMFLLLKKTRNYDSEFLQFPRKADLQTNFYLGL
ncbi:MAG TPA: methionine biosynthesis protein MetW [Selenomonadales bacterium]|nr:methionine biosynthesis protein MetW [Selenomonadales bacterium]